VSVVNNKNIVAFMAGISLLVLLLVSLLVAQWPSNWELRFITNEDFARVIFNEYGLTFMVVGLVMFVSMIGGVFLAQEESE
jgi:NADH:ubiquinone oxidoreductase subunit 6 (subunit J)